MYKPNLNAKYTCINQTLMSNIHVYKPNIKVYNLMPSQTLSNLIAENCIAPSYTLNSCKQLKIHIYNYKSIFPIVQELR